MQQRQEVDFPMLWYCCAVLCS